MSTIKFASDDGVFNPRKILRPSPLHENDVVLLEIMTFPWDEGDSLLPITESHFDTLSVGRVGLLWLSDQSLKNDALQLRTVVGGMSLLGVGFLAERTSSVKLIQGDAPGQGRCIMRPQSHQ